MKELNIYEGYSASSDIMTRMYKIIGCSDDVIILSELKLIMKSVLEKLPEDRSGLCDHASQLIRESIMTNLKPNFDIVVKMVHGEQKHCPSLQSKYWHYQHTWVEVSYRREDDSILKYYMDATSGQFSDIYENIPDTIISTEPLKWYYPDSENPSFSSKPVRWLNKHIKIGRAGLYEFIQYEIWGRISDLIRSLKK